MTTQPGANLYTQGFGSRPENVEVPIISSVAPSAHNIQGLPLGKRWIDTAANVEYALTSISSSGGVTTGTWTLLGAGSGVLSTLTTDDLTIVTPTAGNINLSGTGSITTVGSGSTATVELTGLTNHSLLVGAGTATITKLGVATNGQLPIGSTGADPVLAAITAGAGITVTNGAGSITIAATGAELTLTGNSGGAISPSAGNINTVGTGSITIVGSGSTLTTQLTGLTNHNVLVGAGTATITAVAPSATSGVALISQGAAADPAYGTVVVAGGGTGATTLTGVLTGNGTSAVTANTVTQHGVVLGGASNAVSSLAVAATGTVLAGATGADPAFTGSPSVSGSLTAATTITATLGAITATNGNLVMGTAGNKIIVPTGSNASAGTSGNMSGTPGAITVSTTACSATAKVFYCRNVTGGTPGEVSITAQDGTGFTLTSTGNETSTFNWWIINA